jgi:hypothetical protein
VLHLQPCFVTCAFLIGQRCDRGWGAGAAASGLQTSCMKLDFCLREWAARSLEALTSQGWIQMLLWVRDEHVGVTCLSSASQELLRVIETLWSWRQDAWVILPCAMQMYSYISKCPSFCWAVCGRSLTRDNWGRPGWSNNTTCVLLYSFRDANRKELWSGTDYVLLLTIKS